MPQPVRSKSAGALRLPDINDHRRRPPGGVQKSSSQPNLRKGGGSATGRPGDPKVPVVVAHLSHKPRSKHRNVLELLADPDIERIAAEYFQSHLHDRSGRMMLKDLQKVLVSFYNTMGLPALADEEVRKQFKRFDFNNDGTMTHDEFLQLFLSSLRKIAFERSSLMGRDFFVKKRTGLVWNAYEQVKQIGAGSFGAAYLCRRKKTGKERVVKAVKKCQARMPVEDIEREILVMRQMDHPHVVRLFEWFEDAGRVYLVLEALKGGTLNEIISERYGAGRPLKEDWVREITRQVVGAMAYCHSMRVIHKDLKDENVMLLKKDPNYEKPFAVIIDLGVAEMFSAVDSRGKVMAGTPVTMAPEVWANNFGPKCDVFSAGCILYQCLSGSLPFMGSSIDPQEWIRLHKKGPDWSLVRTSPLGKSLCQAMLTFSDEKRPTFEACQKHEWFDADPQKLVDIPAEQFAPLRAFCGARAVKRSLLLEVACALPMSKAGKIIDLFEGFDKDGGASLDRQELKSAFKRIGLKDDALLAKTFDALDMDGDGTLSFSEFAAGVLLLFKDVLDDGLHAMFLERDVDGDRMLNRAEAEDFLQNAAHISQRSGGAKQNPKDMLDELFRGAVNVPYERLRDVILGPMGDSP